MEGSALWGEVKGLCDVVTSLCDEAGTKIEGEMAGWWGKEEVELRGECVVGKSRESSKSCVKTRVGFWEGVGERWGKDWKMDSWKSISWEVKVVLDSRSTNSNLWYQRGNQEKCTCNLDD